jgi:hypothetical protein
MANKDETVTKEKVQTTGDMLRHGAVGFAKEGLRFVTGTLSFLNPLSLSEVVNYAATGKKPENLHDPDRYGTAVINRVEKIGNGLGLSTPEVESTTDAEAQEAGSDVADGAMLAAGGVTLAGAGKKLLQRIPRVGTVMRVYELGAKLLPKIFSKEVKQVQTVEKKIIDNTANFRKTERTVETGTTESKIINPTTGKPLRVETKPAVETSVPPLASSASGSGKGWLSNIKDKASALVDAKAPTFWINREKDVAKRLELLAERASKGDKAAEKYIKLTIDQQRLGGEISSAQISAIRTSQNIRSDIKEAMENIYARSGKGIISQTADWISARANYALSHPFRTAASAFALPFHHYKITGAVLLGGGAYDQSSNNGNYSKKAGELITDIGAGTAYAGGQVLRMISPSLYEEAKKELPAVAKTIQAGSENVAGSIKSFGEGAKNEMGTLLGVDPDKDIKDPLLAVADKIPAGMVPGGTVAKGAMHAIQHRDNIKQAQDAYHSGQSPTEIAVGVAEQKFQKIVSSVEGKAANISEAATNEPVQVAQENTNSVSLPALEQPVVTARLEPQTVTAPVEMLTGNAPGTKETPITDAPEAAQNKMTAGITVLRNGWQNKDEKIDQVKQNLDEERRKLEEGQLIASTQQSLDQKMKKLRDGAQEKEEQLLALAHEEADKVKTGIADATHKGKEYLHDKKNQIVEAGITSGLSTVFHKAGEYLEKEWGVGATGIKIGTGALLGATIGGLFDNKMMGLLVGIMAGIVWAAYGNDIKAGASSTASQGLSSVMSWMGMEEDKPVQGHSRPQAGLTPAPAPG